MTRQDLMPRTLDKVDLSNLIDRMFDASFPYKIMKGLGIPSEIQNFGFNPVFDFKSDPEKYTLLAEIPGVPKDQVKLEVQHGVLTLSGEKKEEKIEGANKQVQERCFGSFERSLTLPEDAVEEQISASHKDGLLTITIPRQKPVEKGKVINIA